MIVYYSEIITEVRRKRKKKLNLASAIKSLYSSRLARLVSRITYRSCTIISVFSGAPRPALVRPFKVNLLASTFDAAKIASFVNSTTF